MMVREVERGKREYGGREYDGMEWNGREYDGMEWNGWNGMEGCIEIVSREVIVKRKQG